MKPSPLAGLLALAAAGSAHAQAPSLVPPRSFEPVVVTASRGLAAAPTLRDATVITREEIDASGALSLGELLARRAGVELRATGGAGQPQGIFIRGAGAAQTLVLIDGMRAGSATAGTTSIESIPLEMIERIEVVKGPLSSLYGADAAGGVVQVFTRGKRVPHLFAALAVGSDRDRRASAGIATAEGDSHFSLAMGARKVDAPSATNPRAGFSHHPDRDPHHNAFATFRASHRLWQGELLELEAFASRARTRFDAGMPPEGAAADDRSDQSIAGARLTSASKFTRDWTSRLVLAHGRDELEFHGLFPARFETRQDQVAWINELAVAGGRAIAGVEAVRQRVRPARAPGGGGEDVVLFTHDRRETWSAFASLEQAFDRQRLEMSARRDEEDQFGARTTGSASYGFEWAGLGRVAATYARGFRAPTFNDLYGQSFPGFYVPNPGLRPERSESREVAVRGAADAALPAWRLTAFDNRFEDLIVFSPGAGTVLNVNRARIRGIEASIEAAWKGVRLRASATLQRPRDDATGLRLQSRAEAFGTVEAARSWGAWTAAVVVHASGERFDSADESPASRLPGYALVDARLRYAFHKHWVAELAVTNLADRRYEGSIGYGAPGRAILASLRFDAF